MGRAFARDRYIRIYHRCIRTRLIPGVVGLAKNFNTLGSLRATRRSRVEGRRERSNRLDEMVKQVGDVEHEGGWRLKVGEFGCQISKRLERLHE